MSSHFFFLLQSILLAKAVQATGHYSRIDGQLGHESSVPINQSEPYFHRATLTVTLNVSIETRVLVFRVGSSDEIPTVFEIDTVFMWRTQFP